MTRAEFEERINDQVTDYEYKIVEKVYTWHPAIKGKNEIASLWKIGGMPLIKGMVEIADLAMKLDEEERRIKAQLTKIHNRKKSLRVEIQSMKDALEKSRVLLKLRIM